MIRNSLLLLFCFLTTIVFSQIPDWRLVNWSNAGITDIIGENLTEVNIVDFGAIPNDGIADDEAIAAAISYFAGSYGKIIIPEGEFLFNQTINIPTGITIYGAGNNNTTLKFNLGGSSDMIIINGNLLIEEFSVTKAIKGDNYIILNGDLHSYETGDLLRLSMDGANYMFSDWAMSYMAQILRVKSVNADTIFIESGLRHSFPVGENPIVRKVNPVQDILIAGLKIEREDQSVGQTSNISMNYAYNCQIRAIESYNCNFAHISISNSTNITVSGCYIHDAFAYGGGGQGYGTEISASSGECLIENNIFKHLRHSILMQSGANGNVASYNYSLDAYWTEDFLPAASSGDLVLHGNYAYCNLFEGNIAQNGIIDDSHDKNGPFNTFYRNRLEKYGIVMNFNPPTDSSNFIGNEITNTSFLLGNFTIYGSGNYSWGNNVKGTCNPSSTNNIETQSLYLTESPCYFSSDYEWAPIGYPASINQNILPSKYRYSQGIMCFDTCVTDLTFIEIEKNEPVIFPNPFSNELFFNNSENIVTIEIFDTAGRKIICTKPNNEGRIETHLRSGLYMIKLVYSDGSRIIQQIISQQ